MGTGGSFRERKAVGCEADLSPVSSAELKDAQRYSSTPQYAFI
jgi:hypothetical protein